ncbi:DUF1990 family protein [Planomonospora venezuelensis]|uniref:Uncharacterized protein (UPF0548 family) n=1 Tax=Planomonospora venezuelensis TaxID=1999 RepID=A0A841DDG2_PLAVE|nr:DUF1990 domain-containing protein [Planomonospora venezuelensis]MBB5966887.1 uncharacterized protein (UPF0548 family) [Planomonospora venezuelensis]GIN02388.1 DUF1990 domain-containing protein [Planomonospora venezuelensis]
MDPLQRYLGADFGYPDVGFTHPDTDAFRAGAVPPGYRRVRHRRLLGPGVSLERAAETLLTWQAHARCGLRPVASAPRAAAGVTVVSRLGLGPLRLPAPCRVVWTLEEGDRAGFGYGTLAGHPESGEEGFLLERGPDGRVRFTVHAYTRPGRWYTRLAGPVPGLLQHLFARAYAGALR